MPNHQHSAFPERLAKTIPAHSQQPRQSVRSATTHLKPGGRASEGVAAGTPAQLLGVGGGCGLPSGLASLCRLQILIAADVNRSIRLHREVQLECQYSVVIMMWRRSLRLFLVISMGSPGRQTEIPF